MADATGSVPGRWVGIWTAAPQLAEPADLPPEPFARDGLVFTDSTLRQTIRVSADAQRIRLRLSNAFGGAHLAVAKVCVALPSGGQAGENSIAVGTSRPVTFTGRPGVLVAPGGVAVSDPVDFPVAVAANVTVTLYLATGLRAADGVTSHPGSRTTSYLAAGDHVTGQRLAEAAGVDHWYFLSGVEAWLGQAAAAAVFLGDSLTDGRGSTTNGND
ncbi:MAG: SGNH/GDSL hydrolase family protein, partial [Trebonia sp.]